MLGLRACTCTMATRNTCVLSGFMHGMLVELFCMCLSSDCCVKPVSFVGALWHESRGMGEAVHEDSRCVFAQGEHFRRKGCCQVLIACIVRVTRRRTACHVHCALK